MREFSNRRNPILPLEYHVPDSEGHVMPDGKLYVYGSFDDRADVYCSEKYHVVSTADMEHWMIHEESLNGNQISWFNNPNAPKYPGIDWSHPTPFIQKMIQRDLENGVDMKAKFEEEEHFFHEGSSMRKIGDTYYYVYADMERGKPTSLGYSTSKFPMGPFTYRGIIIDNDGCDPASWNNHGSIECVDGQWYVFYHRCSRGVQQHRRLCIEKIEIMEDGTIPEVKMTSQGVGEPFAPGEVIMGYQACEMSGSVYIGVNEDAESAEKYPEVLMNISAGDEVVFRYVKSEQEWKEISLKYRGSGKVKVKMNGTCAGEITLADNKDVINTTNQEICMEAGEYELELEIVEADKLEIIEVMLA